MRRFRGDWWQVCCSGSFLSIVFAFFERLQLHVIHKWCSPSISAFVIKITVYPPTSVTRTYRCGKLTTRLILTFSCQQWENESSFSSENGEHKLKHSFCYKGELFASERTATMYILNIVHPSRRRTGCCQTFSTVYTGRVV